MIRHSSEYYILKGAFKWNPQAEHIILTLQKVESIGLHQRSRSNISMKFYVVQVFDMFIIQQLLSSVE